MANASDNPSYGNLSKRNQIARLSRSRRNGGGGRATGN